MEKNSLQYGIKIWEGVGIKMSNQSNAQKDKPQTEASVYLVKELVTELFQ